ncbi:MAG TPA: META domain-containing protein [Actinomycetota bacterium]
MRRVLLTLSLATLLPLAACADDGSGSSDGSAPATADELNGRSFVSTEVIGRDLVANTQVRISFEDDRLSASAGCNTISAGYTIDEGSLTLDGQPASTMMGCLDDVATQDGWLTSFLSDGPEAELDGDTLTLTGGEVTMTMLDETVADPAKPLTGTAWTLDTIVEGDAASSVPAGVDPPTLTITDAGEATVFAGCNQGGSSVEVADTTLTFGPMRMTKMACEGDATQVENSVVAVLDGEVAYTIEGSHLTLTNGDQGLVYRAG